MIYTSNYDNCKFGIMVSISGDGGEKIGYIGTTYKKLAPKFIFWKKWFDNIGRTPEMENDKFYIIEYYNKVLKNLNPSIVYKELFSMGDTVMLLCYEEPGYFCHRLIVAYWFEITLGFSIPEVSIKENGDIIYHERQEWIKEILISIINN
ncbi:hypothetical protein D3C76_871460 [compost metagenome]